MKIGLALPSFVRDIDVALKVAINAEREGVSAVFAYDHLFRTDGDGVRRPAIECFALMAAVASETKTIGIGSLVLRASLRPPALVYANLSTIAAIAGADRLIAGIGAGDGESIPEHDAFGISFPALDERVAMLRTVAMSAGRSVPGLSVWVAGTHKKLRAVAAEIGALNVWGVDAPQFSKYARELHTANSAAVATWGGLVVLGDSDEAARERAIKLNAPADTIVGGSFAVAQQLRMYRDGGARWCVLAPIDASNPSNARWCAAVQHEFQ